MEEKIFLLSQLNKNLTRIMYDKLSTNIQAVQNDCPKGLQDNHSAFSSISIADPN
jgi:hypothetical protein